MSLTFSLIGQDKVITESEVDEVLLPTESGYIGVLPHHADLVTLIKTGEITTKHQGKEQYFAVFGGMAQITSKEVVVLADRAEQVDTIDLAMAEEAKKKAEQMVAEAKDHVELAHATGLLERNINRIELVKRRRSHAHRSPQPRETIS